MNKTTKKVLSLALCLCMPLFASSALAEYADGSYTGVGAGMGGDVNVSVTVEGGKIVSVEVGEHNETPGISDPAIEQIPAAIVEAQSADVEGGLRRNRHQQRDQGSRKGCPVRRAGGRGRRCYSV